MRIPSFYVKILVEKVGIYGKFAKDRVFSCDKMGCAVCA